MKMKEQSSVKYLNATYKLLSRESHERDKVVCGKVRKIFMGMWFESIQNVIILSKPQLPATPASKY